MKRTFFAVCLGVFFTCGTFAKSAVVYFSATGNTRRLAATVSKVMDADVFEIVPLVPYTSADLNWNSKKSRSSVECSDPSSRPEIKNKIDLSSYDTVVIAFPIWWYNAPKIIYTFVESANLEGKKIVPVCTSGGSGLGRTGDDLRALCPNADWRKGTRFKAAAGEAEVRKFLDETLR